jgi:3-oxoacyl-[acyl-carrier-protein] synthase II
LQAWEQAELTPADTELDRIGTVLGSGGCINSTEKFFLDTIREQPTKPSRLLNFSPDAAGTFISNHFGLRGPKSSIMTACSSGATAIGFAADLIRAGYADVMITGGVEALSTVTLSGFNSLAALSTGDIKPFDANREGIVLGEGAGILILEDYDKALARGAKILAEFCGYGFTSDAHHITAPHPTGNGMVKAMQQAVAEANIECDQIKYINAHGTGTELNDKSETASVRRMFGDHANKLCMSSTKSMIGHTLSAAGAIEAVATVLALLGQFAPPNINYETLDPECDLDVVPNQSRNLSMDYAMSNSLAFGGNNTSLIFKREGAYV